MLTVKSRNGLAVQVEITLWPLIPFPGVMTHAILTMHTEAGGEYRRHETARFPTREQAEQAAYALLVKRGYTTWPDASDRLASTSTPPAARPSPRI